MPTAAYQELMKLAGLPLPPEGTVTIAGCDPVVDTPFRLGEAAAAALAAQGSAVAQIWEMRSGRRQQISVDVTAAALSLISELYVRQEGQAVALPDPTYPTVAIYPTKDGRWVMVHGGYPALRNGILKLLNAPNEADAIAAAVAKWDAQDLEDAIAERKLCGAMIRTEAEWLAHPQGQALSQVPVVEIVKIGDSDPVPLPPGARPLSGVRALDLTHVLAGPTGARMLAEQGADVLHIRAPDQPYILPFVMDTNWGKLSAFLDLKQAAQADQLRSLLRTADIFSDSYRPGALAKLGFGPEDCAAIRPGIIYVSFSCYGEMGPWGDRPGWEQLAQCVTGVAAEQGTPDQPKLLPVYPNDYITGYLAAFGAMAALIRRAREGGSYHVRVALSRTAMWYQSLGRVPSSELPPPTVSPETLAKLCMDTMTCYGRLTHMKPVTQYSETPGRYDRPVVPLGSQRPVWPTV